LSNNYSLLHIKPIRINCVTVPVVDFHYEKMFADTWMATTFPKRVVEKGTLRGSVSSAVRNTLIWTLLKTRLTNRLAARFAMRTIPFVTIDKMAPSE
jgi:hypothetical protein